MVLSCFVYGEARKQLVILFLVEIVHHFILVIYFIHFYFVISLLLTCALHCTRFYPNYIDSSFCCQFIIIPGELSFSFQVQTGNKNGSNYSLI